MNLRSVLRRPSFVLAVVLLVLVVLFVLAVPLLSNYDPYTQSLRMSLLAPGAVGEGGTAVLGTDTLGRDLMSRLALAGRISLFVGVAAVSVSLVVGTVLGLVAGFFGGKVESTIMGLADIQLSIPRILLLIAVVAVVGASVRNLVVLLGLTSWVAYGRVARAMALSLREREFVLAAKSFGASPVWNVRKHILANVAPQMIIVASFELGQMVVLEASLSYLGLGVQPPTPSWGLMIADGQSYMRSAPWIAILPGVAIFMVVTGVQFLTQLFTAEGAQGRTLAKTHPTGA